MSQKPTTSSTKRSSKQTSTSSNKHITKISAQSAEAKSAKTKSTESNPAQTESTTTQSPAKSAKNSRNQAKIAKAAAKANGRPAKTAGHKAEKPLKKVFILARPFVALGRYLRDSWHELRQVRWPSRKATWKMTLAVLCYCAIFMVFIIVLDSFFTFIFNLLLGRN